VHYHSITETNRPPEICLGTVEYVLPRHAAAPPVFLFVVDLCLETAHELELAALKDSLLLSLSLIPETAFVGLITFGHVVQVYELAFEHCPKSYVILL
jgi:protein transport protein SEC23